MPSLILVVVFFCSDLIKYYDVSVLVLIFICGDISQEFFSISRYGFGLSALYVVSKREACAIEKHDS